MGAIAVGLQQRLPLSLTWALLDEVAHAALAVIVTAWLVPTWGVRAVLIAVLAATAIDLDHVLAAGSIAIERLTGLGARPPTHSLPGAVVIGALVSAAAGRRAGYAAAAGVLSHVLRDSLSAPGVPLLLLDANRHVVLPEPVVLGALAALTVLSMSLAHLTWARVARLGRPWERVARLRLPWAAGLGVVLLLGALVRLPLLGRDSGVYDAGYFRALMRAGATDLPNAYRQVSPDYPPLTVLTFGLTGALTNLCCTANLAVKDTPTVVGAKLPEVVASLALAAIIGSLVRRRTGVAALAGLAAAGYALNPGAVYVSAFWTQAEALWVLPIVLGLLAIERRRFGLAWLAFTAGVLTKPQAAAFVPLLLVATWRHAPRSAWLKGPAVALGLVAACSAPWWLTGHAADVAQVYVGLSGADAWVSGSAYNLWYLWLLGRTHQVPADSALLGEFLSYQHAGWLLFALLVGWVVRQASRERGGPSLFLCAATLWLGLAVLLTQTHERYFHPVLPLLLLAPELYAARSRLWLVWTAVTLAYAYNLITVLPFEGFPGPSLIAEPGGGIRVALLRSLSLVAAATFLTSLVALALHLRSPGTQEQRAWAFAR